MSDARDPSGDADGPAEGVRPPADDAAPTEAYSEDAAFEEPAPSRRWSRALVAAAAVLVLVVTAVQLSGMFFYNAPANPVSTRYAQQLRDWMQPLFDQNWHLFAPNPYSENVEIEARASVAGTGRTTPWFDLSARDRAQLTGDPAPGHELQNSLRNAWLDWNATHDGNGDPTAATGNDLQQYLLNLVAARLAPLVGAPIGSVEIRVTVTLLPLPGRTKAETAPQTRDLGWWTVAAS